MEIEIVFGIGDRVYFLSRKNDVPCWVCQGKKSIVFRRSLNEVDVNSPEFLYAKVIRMMKPSANIMVSAEHTCPHWKGKGVVKPEHSIYQVEQGTIVEIKYSENGNGKQITYVVKRDLNDSDITNEDIYVLKSDLVYAVLDKAEKACQYLNLPRLVAKIDAIKIATAFEKTIPCNEKLMKRMDEFKKNGVCEPEILIREDGTLFDGYTSYLTYRMMGWKQMPVVIVSNEQYAMFKNSLPDINKEYLKKYKKMNKLPVMEDVVNISDNHGN